MDNTGLVIGDSYHKLAINYGNGEYNMFEPTKMNQLVLGWGMKDDEFMVDFNQTGKFKNLPSFVKEFGLVSVQVGNRVSQSSKNVFLRGIKSNLTLSPKTVTREPITEIFRSRAEYFRLFQHFS